MRIAALDIGGTMIKSAMWEDGRLLDVRSVETEAAQGGDAVMAKAIAVLKTYGSFDRIGISTAGQVNSEQGIIRYANENIPGYTGMCVKHLLGEAFGVPVAVENDVNAAAIGETWYGAGREFDDFLCLTYGTGVGGAIVLNKQVYKGSVFSAGEFGAMITHGEDRVANDEFSGSYERYASTSALVRAAMNYDERLDNGKKIFEKIADQKVKEIVDQWLKEITYGLTNLIYIFNPSCIVLGGGVFAQSYAIEKLREMLYTSIMPSFKDLVLKQAELGNQAGLLGAIHLANSLEG